MIGDSISIFASIGRLPIELWLLQCCLKQPPIIDSSTKFENRPFPDKKLAQVLRFCAAKNPRFLGAEYLIFSILLIDECFPTRVSPDLWNFGYLVLLPPVRTSNKFDKTGRKVTHRSNFDHFMSM
jgi:hypothetical protein